jgi:hypothetical protein
MAADIYTMFRRFIGDYTPDYTLPDEETLKFLDQGILAASRHVPYIVDEDITITTTDISNGYFSLSNEFMNIQDTEIDISKERVYWQTEGTDKIRLIDSSVFSAGTYNFVYNKKYKTFDGEVRSNDYFDYPRDADLGIVFWALAEYQNIKGVINADNSANLIASKSEEGMSESYRSVTVDLGNPKQLKRKALDIFENVSNKANINFSVTV